METFMRLSEIKKILNAQHIGADVQFDTISTDTRSLKAGDLFLALKGPNFNGNLFVKDAAQKGAVAAIISEDVSAGIPLLKVSDTRIALGQIATFHRQQFNIPVVALTGSCGKTTTKTMLASILQQLGSTLATEGNLNNDIGVPKTLLELRPEHQYAVIEMGANHPGEIAYVTAIAKPTVAFITNAGAAHLEGFGSLAGVASAKGEIFQGLNKDGIALVNIDDTFAEFWQDLVKQKKVISFGRNMTADITARDLEIDAQGYPNFVLVTPKGEIKISLSVLGEHNVTNALAAAAASYAVGAPLTAIQAGLAAMKPVKQRLITHKGLHGATVIDDSYNANPSSVKAAIQLLAKATGEKILALGEMRELGPDAPRYHEEIGREAKRLGIDRLYAYGTLTAFTVKGFGAQGFHFANQEEMIDALRRELRKDVTVLVKGSSSTKMNNVVAGLL